MSALLLNSFGLLGLCSQAAAMGLGNAQTQSRIGGPLRIEIPVQAEDADRVELSCIRLAAPPAAYNEELPWLARARLSLEQKGNNRLLVVSAVNNNHPAIMLGIQINCGLELRRDYTLLLNPPLSEELPQLPETPRTSPARTSTTAPLNPVQPSTAPSLLTADGDSARSLANRLYPGDPSAQRRMARALLSHNAARLGTLQGTYTRLPAGIELAIPPLPAKLPETTGTGEAATDSRAASRPDLSAAPAPRPSKTRDRLRVSGTGEESGLQLSTAIGQRKELSEDQRDRLRTELQLIASLDEKIASQLELADRLRQLEALQARLKQDAERLENELRHQQSAQTAAQSTPQPQATPRQNTPLATTESWLQAPGYIVGGLLGLAGLLGAGLWFWRRRQQPEQSGDTLLLPDADISGEIGEHLIEPLSEADIWPDEEGHAPRANPRMAASMEGALGMLSASGLGPASMLQIVEDDVEEHDSAVELAEIMMSFGRVQGAAQTLADFIRANPKQAVKPWIKLLEVYRAANMRVEYEALTTQLNKTFNVRTVSWDEFEIARQAPESLESLPHIMTRLHETWGRRECQAMLHELLRDNRQGTRQGFPLAIIDEILLLLGILESQIGPFRPDPGETPPAQSRTQTLHAATAALAIPPLVSEPVPFLPESPLAENAPSTEAVSASYAAGSLSQLDFELDMTDLSKTLHINLDELNDDSPDTPR